MIVLLAGAGGRRGTEIDDPVRVPAARAPAGLVALFSTPACPDGWQPAVVAAGRMMVGTMDPMAVGRPVGTALVDAEDRPHAHSIDTVLALPTRSISAADGSNDSGAAAGTSGLTGAAMAASSGLPFVQLTACVRP